MTLFHRLSPVFTLAAASVVFAQEPANPLAVPNPNPASAAAAAREASPGDSLRGNEPSPSARTILVQLTPDAERSELIHEVIEALDKARYVRTSPPDLSSSSVGSAFIASISVRPDMASEDVTKLLRTLRDLDVSKAIFAVRSTDKSSVIITSPADVTWRTVRRMQEELAKHTHFEVDVRVRAHDGPPTPTLNTVPTYPSSASTPQNAKTSPTNESTGRQVTVLTLKHAKAAGTAAIVEQIHRGRINLAVDERTNTLLLVGGDESVVKEVEELLRVLDVAVSDEGDASGLSQPAAAEKGDSTSTQLAPGPIASALDFRGKGQTFSFYVGLADQSTDVLRKQFQDLERQSRELAAKLRLAANDSPAGKILKERLVEAVRKSFEARQQLQRAELAEFAQRLQHIQQSIESRERIADQITNRRVEELLDANLDWEASDATESLQPIGQVEGSPAQATAKGNKAFETPAESTVLELLGARFQPVVAELRPGTSSQSQELQISELTADGPAARARLRVGDRLIGIDRWQIASLEHVIYAWTQTRGDNPVKVLAVRGKQTMHAQLTWPDVPSANRLRSGIVLSRSGKDVIASLGTNDGIHPGDQLQVFSGQTQLGSLNVVFVQKDRSITRVAQESTAMPIRKGDRVTSGRIDATSQPDQPAESPSGPKASGNQLRRQDFVQIALGNENLGKIQWIAGPGSVMRDGFGTRINTAFGSQIQFRLSDIPGREDAKVFVTLEIPELKPEAIHKTSELLLHNSIPVTITAEDLDQVLSGNLVTKAVYIPDDLTTAGESLFNVVVSSRLEPGVDPVTNAESRGMVVAGIRLSSSAELNARTSSATESNVSDRVPKEVNNSPQVRPASKAE